MGCPATLGALQCQRTDPHLPHKGCVYHATRPDNLGRTHSAEEDSNE